MMKLNLILKQLRQPGLTLRYSMRLLKTILHLGLGLVEDSTIPSPIRASYFEWCSTTKEKRASEPRVPKERGNTKFLTQFANIQESTQKSMIEHESKLQTESMEFQQRMEQDRLRFESELTQRLQQQSQQFQVQIMQSTQAFQAELFKRLFNKDN